MTPALPFTAATLRERFRAIPREARHANHPFSIRVWRGLSWLERSETADDPEGRLISLWIAFNAIYGYLEDDGRDARDHASWQNSLAQLVRQDAGDALGRIIRGHQRDILRLVDNKFLFRPFWLGQHEAGDKLRQAVRRCLKHYNDGCTLAILQELFERLYVLRMQVFHGAATSGSRLNRATLERGARMLSTLVPEMLSIMIAAGPSEDWGEVCFPPIEEGRDG